MTEHPTERQTNVEWVKDLMEYSPHGALVQAFIIQAIETYAELVIEAGPERVDTPLVAGIAWHGIATDIKAKCVARMGK